MKAFKLTPCDDSETWVTYNKANIPMSDLRVVAFMTNMFLLIVGKDIMKIPDQKINIRCVFNLLEI